MNFSGSATGGVGAMGRSGKVSTQALVAIALSKGVRLQVVGAPAPGRDLGPQGQADFFRGWSARKEEAYAQECLTALASNPGLTDEVRALFLASTEAGLLGVRTDLTEAEVELLLEHADRAALERLSANEAVPLNGRFLVSGVLLRADLDVVELLVTHGVDEGTAASLAPTWIGTLGELLESGRELGPDVQTPHVGPPGSRAQ